MRGATWALECIGLIRRVASCRREINKEELLVSVNSLRMVASDIQEELGTRCCRVCLFQTLRLFKSSGSATSWTPRALSELLASESKTFLRLLYSSHIRSQKAPWMYELSECRNLGFWKLYVLENFILVIKSIIHKSCTFIFARTSLYSEAMPVLSK
ncbi:hypothetical protein J6590_080867 [Homalodisca vitripennis]|nr:hypothetical protein J6590_080867 [Homalodisca vitripennis]